MAHPGRRLLCRPISTLKKLQHGGSPQIKSLNLDMALWIFFRPTHYGSRQVVNQSGQPVAFCKFPELMQWQHHHDDNVHQKVLGWIDT